MKPHSFNTQYVCVCVGVCLILPFQQQEATAELEMREHEQVFVVTVLWNSNNKNPSAMSPVGHCSIFRLTEERNQIT